jgi:hypothetical protein
MTMQTLVAKLVGRRLLRSGRQQVREHVQWLTAHGFDQDFAQWVQTRSLSAEAAQLLQLSRNAS